MSMLPTPRGGATSSLREPFGNLEREFDRMVNRMADFWGMPTAENGTVTYPVDIRETDDQIFIEAEMPGFTKDDIDVSLDAGMITISAERKQESEQEGTQHLKERRYTKIQRSFSLPSSVDEKNVVAQLENGVLTISLQKREEQKRHKIQVK